MLLTSKPSLQPLIQLLGVYSCLFSLLPLSPLQKYQGNVLEEAERGAWDSGPESGLYKGIIQRILKSTYFVFMGVFPACVSVHSVRA